MERSKNKGRTPVTLKNNDELDCIGYTTRRVERLCRRAFKIPYMNYLRVVQIFVRTSRRVFLNARRQFGVLKS